MHEKPLHSVLIVENNDQGKLYIVEDKYSKSTVENILENPVDEITSEIKHELELEFQSSYYDSSSINNYESLSPSIPNDTSIHGPIEDQKSELENLKDKSEESELTNFFGEFYDEDFKDESVPDDTEKETNTNNLKELRKFNKNSTLESPDEATNCLCKYCDKTFNSVKKMRKHECLYLKDCSNKNFLCRICNKELSKKSFQYHMSTHNSSEESLDCDVCKKKFKNERLLSLHSTIHSGNKPHRCEHCISCFLTRQQLVRHMAKHGIPPPLYKCDFCHKSFSYKHYLTLHLNMHSGNPVFKCEKCQRAFERKDYLKEHYLTAHSNQKNFVCEHCNKSFALKKYLRRHKTIHATDNKDDYVCHVCMKALSGQKQLENHLMLHTGERNHTCEVCGRNFVTKSALTNHMYNHQAHPNPPSIKCTFCDKYFSRKSDLKRHISSHPNQKPHKCFYCTKSYLHKSQLQRHLCQHTGEKPKMYTCEICNKELTQKYYLNQHMLAKHGGELKYFCSICSKGFPAQNQLNRHTKSCSNRKKKPNEKQEQSSQIQISQQILQPHFEQPQIHIIQGDQIIIQTTMQDITQTNDILIL